MKLYTQRVVVFLNNSATVNCLTNNFTQAAALRGKSAAWSILARDSTFKY